MAGERLHAKVAAEQEPLSAPDALGRPERPVLSMTLWPHRSLSTRGFSGFVALTGAGLAVPLLPLMGSKVAWGLLPFLVAVLLAIYIAIQRSFSDGRLTEELRLWPDLITVERREPTGRVRRWEANPCWVSVGLSKTARLENYLTLKGNGREIELGAFLSPEERVRLHDEIVSALSALRNTPSAPMT